MSSKYFISIRSAGYILSRLLIAKVEKTTYPNVLHGDFESLLYCDNILLYQISDFLSF